MDVICNQVLRTPRISVLGNFHTLTKITLVAASQHFMVAMIICLNLLLAQNRWQDSNFVWVSSAWHGRLKVGYVAFVFL